MQRAFTHLAGRAGIRRPFQWSLPPEPVYFSSPEARAGLEDARASAQVGRQIHALRTEAGLTQRELATRIGTKHTAICRLEGDDYEGHSLAMLRRIAKALGKRVEIHFVPDPEAKSAREPVEDQRSTSTGA